MKLSANSEKKAAGIKPELARVVRRAAELAGTDPALDFVIVQGSRTQAQQNALYAQGRTAPGRIVTWTKNSKHIGGGAIDFAALEGGKISWNEKLYPPIANVFLKAATAERVGIEWGGSWGRKDWGHIQLNPAKLGQNQSAGGTTVPVFEVLQKGVIGGKVEELQTKLTQLGFYQASVDGHFGPITDASVRAYQAARRLRVDGLVGPLTWTLLQREVPPEQVVVPSPLVLPGSFTAGKDYDRIVRFYEGERLHAYQIGGLWHIGIGHHGAFPGQVLSVSQMNDLFAKDTAERVAELNKIIKVSLNQRQFDALASLYFNRPRTFAANYAAGSGDNPGDDLLDAVNAGDFNRAELEFLELVSAPSLDGRVYAGLAARRQTEADLFVGQAYSLG